MKPHNDPSCPCAECCRYSPFGELLPILINRVRKKRTSRKITEIKLLKELENVVRYGHAMPYWNMPKRTEHEVLLALDKFRRIKSKVRS